MKEGSASTGRGNDSNRNNRPDRSQQRPLYRRVFDQWLGAKAPAGSPAPNQPTAHKPQNQQTARMNTSSDPATANATVDPEINEFENSVEGQEPETPQQEANDTTTEPVVEPVTNTAEASDSNDPWKERYIRLAADFDNFKKRTNKEYERLAHFGGEPVLKGLLPLIDDLERTVKATATATDVEAIREGVIMVTKKFYTALERQGVKPVDSLGQPFNSELHEAIASVPHPDETQKGLIIDEVERGFYYHDKVIRFSKVVIAE